MMRLASSTCQRTFQRVTASTAAAYMSTNDLYVKVSKKINTANKEKKHKLAKELSDIVIICQSASFKSFDHSQAKCE